jgi:hypothetical protein
MIDTIKSILIGVSAGFVSALVGYFRHTPVPDFSGKKFFKTIIIGAIVGGASPFFTTDITTQFLEAFGYVTVIDRIADLIWARLKGLWHRIVEPIE